MPLTGCRNHGFLPASEKRIDRNFFIQSARNGDLSQLACLLDFPGSPDKIRILRFHGEGELAIGQGVFMRAVNAGVRRAQ
jgi:hypothetical protein